MISLPIQARLPTLNPRVGIRSSNVDQVQEHLKSLKNPGTDEVLELLDFASQAKNLYQGLKEPDKKRFAQKYQTIQLAILEKTQKLVQSGNLQNLLSGKQDPKVTAIEERINAVKRASKFGASEGQLEQLELQKKRLLKNYQEKLANANIPQTLSYLGTLLLEDKSRPSETAKKAFQLGSFIAAIEKSSPYKRQQVRGEDQTPYSDRLVGHLLKNKDPLVSDSLVEQELFSYIKKVAAKKDLDHLKYLFTTVLTPSSGKDLMARVQQFAETSSDSKDHTFLPQLYLKVHEDLAGPTRKLVSRELARLGKSTSKEAKKVYKGILDRLLAKEKRKPASKGKGASRFLDEVLFEVIADKSTPVENRREALLIFRKNNDKGLVEIIADQRIDTYVKTPLLRELNREEIRELLQMPTFRIRQGGYAESLQVALGKLGSKVEDSKLFIKGMEILFEDVQHRLLYLDKGLIQQYFKALTFQGTPRNLRTFKRLMANYSFEQLSLQEQGKSVKLIESFLTAIGKSEDPSFNDFIAGFVLDGSFSNSIRNQAIDILIKNKATKAVLELLQVTNLPLELRNYLISKTPELGVNGLKVLSDLSREFNLDSTPLSTRKAVTDALISIQRKDLVPPVPGKRIYRPTNRGDYDDYLRELLKYRKYKQKEADYIRYSRTPVLYQNMVRNLAGGLAHFGLQQFSENGKANYLESLPPEGLGRLAAKLLEDQARNDQNGVEDKSLKKQVDQVLQVAKGLSVEDFVKFRGEYKPPGKKGVSQETANRPNGAWQKHQRFIRDAVAKFKSQGDSFCDPDALTHPSSGTETSCEVEDFSQLGSEPIDRIDQKLLSKLKSELTKNSFNTSNIIKNKLRMALEINDSDGVISKENRALKNYLPTAALGDREYLIPSERTDAILDVFLNLPPHISQTLIDTNKESKEIILAGIPIKDLYQKPENQEKLLNALEDALAPTSNALEDVKNLFLNHYKENSLVTTGVPQQFWALLQKHNKVESAFLMDAWSEMLKNFKQQTINLCLENNKDAPIEKLLESGVGLLVPNKELYKILLDKRFMIKFVAKNWPDGASLSEFRKSPYYKQGILSDQELLISLAKARSVLMMRDRLMKNYLSALEVDPFIMKRYQSIYTAYQDAKEKGKVPYSLEREFEEAKKDFHNFYAGQRDMELALNKMFQNDDLKVHDFFNFQVKKAKERGNDNYELAKRKMAKKAAEERDKYTNTITVFKSRYLQMVQGAFTLAHALDPRSLYGSKEGGKAIYSWHETLNNTELPGYGKIGSLYGDDLGSTSSLSMVLRAGFSPFRTIFDTFDQIFDDFEMANIMVQLNVNKAQARKLLASNNYLKAGHVGLRMAQFAIGTLLSGGTNLAYVSIKGLGKMAYKKAIRIALKEGNKEMLRQITLQVNKQVLAHMGKQVLYNGAYSGAGALAEEMIRTKDSGFDKDSLGNILSGTAEGTVKSIFSSGVNQKLVSMFGKIPLKPGSYRPDFSKFDDVVKMRQRLADILDKGEALSSDVPDAIDSVVTLGNKLFDPRQAKKVTLKEIAGVGLKAFLSAADVVDVNFSAGKANIAAIQKRFKSLLDSGQKIDEKKLVEVYGAITGIPKEKLKGVDGKTSKEFERFKSTIVVYGMQNIEGPKKKQLQVKLLELKDFDNNQEQALQAAEKMEQGHLSDLDFISLQLTALTGGKKKGGPFTMDQAIKLVSLGGLGHSSKLVETNKAFSTLTPEQRELSERLVENEIESFANPNAYRKVAAITPPSKRKETIISLSKQGPDMDVLVQGLMSKDPAIKAFFEGSASPFLKDIAKASLLSMQQELDGKSYKEVGDFLKNTELVSQLTEKIKKAIECSKLK